MLEPTDVKPAIILHSMDNVATALRMIPKGSVVITVQLAQDIHFGHKFAIADIEKGCKVYKYGTPIGFATMNIRKGEHVHSHNLQTLQKDVKEDERI